ncbi:GNAT family N-acetyltransferase [Frankia sp. CcI49]|uniref:GNAT family N-acetyltransferase n=1 Tax=Frankia sp. CcI49 TaxID=1745382 RepID=UPI0009764F6D|nr:GNAT family N-acetyltransferase [Frankia sp. CcI49]ONH53532.1 GNAT family N-acetyltransferase [Frankia sp. CcI49]
MIRAAQHTDVAAVLALVHGLAAYEREPDAVSMTDEDLVTALFGDPPAAYCLVALDAGTVVGCALWHPTFSTWTGKAGMYLIDLFVRPEHRRHGHGRALLAELAQLCVQHGYQRLEWAVLDWNTPAHVFYRSVGAAPTSEWTTWRLDATAITALAGPRQSPDIG